MLAAELTAKDPAERPASAAAVAERAGHLRDTLAHGGVPRGPDRLAPATTATDAQPVTLVHNFPPDFADDEVASRPPTDQRLRGSRSWPGRGVVLALAAVALIAGLTGWLLASAFAGASPPRPEESPAAGPSASAPAPRTVTVNDGPLVGQPVSTVSEQLRQLGLRPRVAWIASDQQDPGTVVSVQPTGQLPAGSTVLVTAVAQPGHGHGNGNGNGKGNGNGNGEGNGGD